jgi:hypothetical protein
MLAKGAFAQYQSAINSGTTPLTIVVPAGQVMQVFSFSHQSGVNTSNLLFNDGFSTYRQWSSKAHDDPTVFDPKQIFFVGPGEVTIVGTGGAAAARLIYKISDNTAVSGSVPSNTVVIPADASGTVNIILESSTDLVTWTAALPGSYGSSTSKRFFRVRAVNQ